MPSNLSNQRGDQLRLVSNITAPEKSDAALVSAVVEGSPLAAARVWESYSALVRRILRRSLGPSADVEDAVQEVFLRLFRDIKTLREPTALRSFLIGITLHVATSEIRRRRARRWLRLSDNGVTPETEPITDETQLEQREALQRLYRLLERIDTHRRLVFVLRYVEGVELVELSTILGCSLATTKRRVADASSRVCRLAAADPVLAPYLTRQT
jgi:RNA polymerase sigma-70 factor (ECF subfamily)